MTSREQKTLNRIPKKYREHIVSLTISKSGDFNDRGQELWDYTVEWDNGDVHTFQSIEYMLYLIKECTAEDGYYYSL